MQIVQFCFYSRDSKRFDSYLVGEPGKVTWEKEVIEKIAGVFQTHVLKIHFENYLREEPVENQGTDAQ